MPKVSKFSGQLHSVAIFKHSCDDQQALCNSLCSGDGFKRAVAQIQRWGRWIGEGSKQCLSLDHHAWRGHQMGCRWLGSTLKGTQEHS